MKIKIASINSVKEWTYSRDLKRFSPLVTKKILAHINKKDRVASYLSNKFLLDFAVKNHIDESQFDFVNNKNWIVRSSPKFFSASRNGEYVLFGEDNIPLGVDIQAINKDVDFLNIATRFFSRHELNCILSSNDPLYTFYEIWGNKESLFKCVAQPILIFDLKLENKKEKWFATYEGHKYYFKNIIYDSNYMISLCSFSPITDEIIYKDKQE